MPIDTLDKGKNINTAVSPEPVYVINLWRQGQWKQCMHRSSTHVPMYSATCVYVYFILIGKFNWIWEL